MRSEVREARERRISAPPHMGIHDAHLRRDGVIAKEGEDQLPDTLPMHAGGRRPLLIALAARVINAKIVLRMRVEIPGGNAIAARCGFACQGEVALEYLVGAAVDLDVGPAAVECLIVLRDSRLLSKRAICIKATARPLIWS